MGSQSKIGKKFQKGSGGVRVNWQKSGNQKIHKEH